MAETFVHVRDLYKFFKGITAVAGVSFTIEKGEIFGLLGPNGAGKTTTIRMMSTTLSISEGDVTIGGHSVHDSAAAIRRLIGVCPQEIALYPELSALDNLLFFGRMEGLSRVKALEQAQKNLALVGLAGRMRDRVVKFSGGMKRRVNLAVSLMSRPELLFLDEPTVGVDPQSRNHIFNTIEGLREEGMTILYTTHYMEEADRPWRPVKAGSRCRKLNPRWPGRSWKKRSRRLSLLPGGFHREGFRRPGNRHDRLLKPGGRFDPGRAGLHSPRRGGGYYL